MLDLERFSRLKVTPMRPLNTNESGAVLSKVGSIFLALIVLVWVLQIEVQFMGSGRSFPPLRPVWDLMWTTETDFTCPN